MGKKWFSAKCIFRYDKLSEGVSVFEERVVLVEAVDLDEAISRGEVEAKAFAARSGCEYLSYINVYECAFEQPKDGAEVYSQMRRSLIESDDYIDHFYDTGLECCSENAIKFSLAYLSDVVYGVEPMTRGLANRVRGLRRLLKLGYYDVTRDMTVEKGEPAVLYQLGKGLSVMAAKHLSDDQWMKDEI